MTPELEDLLDAMRSKLVSIVQLTRDEVGRSEENVKQKIVVPLLECLGHQRTQLDFEYGIAGRRVDIFIKNLPMDCKVIIDTKNYDEDLNNHLEQIGLYAFHEGALLALIINGEEIRIYDPFFRGFSFKDSLLYSLKRADLNNGANVEILYNLLSRDRLKSRDVKEFVLKREQEIIETHSKIEKMKEKFEKKKKDLSDERERLIEKLNEIQINIKSMSEHIAALDSERDDEINKILELAGLPYLRITPKPLPPTMVHGHIVSKLEKVEILLNNLHTPRKFALIPVPIDYRGFFPGYKVSFILETDIGPITTKVTSAPKDTKIGDPHAGKYIQGGLKPWYDNHEDLKQGNRLVIEVIEPKKRYRLTVLR